MKLADYLAAEKITLDVFAKRIGRTAPTVSRIARGVQQPDWDTVAAIEAETAGAVTANDFALPPKNAAEPERAA